MDPSDPRRRSAGARVTLTVEQARAIQGLCINVWNMMEAGLTQSAQPQAAAPAVPAAQQRAAEEPADGSLSSACSTTDFEGWQPQLDVAALAVPKCLALSCSWEAHFA